MADEIKLTLEQEAPQAPSLTLEGVETPSLTLGQEEAPAPKQVQADEISTLDEASSLRKSGKWWTISRIRST